MSHGLQIALSIVAGLGIGGWVTSFFDRRATSNEARKARDHATAEARAVRRFNIYFDSYKRISIHLERVRAWVVFTEPLVGPGPEPPQINVDEAMFELTGTVAVTASTAARERLDASTETVRQFQYAVAEWQFEPVKGWAEDPQGRTPRAKLEDARAAAMRAIDAAQKAMRDELADL